MCLDATHNKFRTQHFIRLIIYFRFQVHKEALSSASNIAHVELTPPVSLRFGSPSTQLPTPPSSIGGNRKEFSDFNLIN